jgi:hypothetical protein
MPDSIGTTLLWLLVAVAVKVAHFVISTLVVARRSGAQQKIDVKLRVAQNVPATPSERRRVLVTGGCGNLGR